MKKNIFVYKDDMINLNKVSIIECDKDENTITFYMDNDWEYEIEIDEEDDFEKIKKELVEKFATI